MDGTGRSEGYFDRSDPRQLTARLAAAIMIADGRITDSEMLALRRLRDLGFGALEARVQAEIEEAVRTPIDLAATIAELGRVAPQAAAALVDGLTHIAASDHDLSPQELRVLTAIAEGLGLETSDTEALIRAAVEEATRAEHGARGRDAAAAPPARAGATASPPAGPAPPAPAADQAFRILGLQRGASIEQADAAFALFVRRYNPAAVLELGPEFAVLAVQKLSAITAAYVAARSSLQGR